MIPLRPKMTDDLVRRNYAESTARVYLRARTKLKRSSSAHLTNLAPNTSANYTADLFEDRNLSSSAVNPQVAALRFFYF